MGLTMYQMVTKYTNIFRCKTLQNLPKLVFLVWKYSIWHSWLGPDHFPILFGPSDSRLSLAPTIFSRRPTGWPDCASFRTPLGQGCQMVCFQTQNHNLGKLLRGNVDIFYGHLEYFKAIWEILWPFATFCVDLVFFSEFGIMYQQKSGTPALGDCFSLGCFLKSTAVAWIFGPLFLRQKQNIIFD
jgi:hypothetical protein